MSDIELENNWDLYFSGNKDNQFIALLNFYRLNKEPSKFIGKHNKLGENIMFKCFLKTFWGKYNVNPQETVGIFIDLHNFNEANSMPSTIRYQDSLNQIIILPEGCIILPSGMYYEPHYKNVCALSLNNLFSYETHQTPNVNSKLFGLLAPMSAIIQRQFYGILLGEDMLPDELV